jgi:hypothetical protein
MLRGSVLLAGIFSLISYWGFTAAVWPLRDQRSQVGNCCQDYRKVRDR